MRRRGGVGAFVVELIKLGDPACEAGEIAVPMRCDEIKRTASLGCDFIAGGVEIC